MTMQGREADGAGFRTSKSRMQRAHTFENADGAEPVLVAGRW